MTESGLKRAPKKERLDLQALVRMALRLAEEDPDNTKRRVRLLETILDGFAAQPEEKPLDHDEQRLARAWALAAQNLGAMRSLVDVAALINLRESAFRTLHRNVHGTSAGAYLRGLRMSQAESLLATTGLSMTEIARQVGYGHAETLNGAFRQSRGMTPGTFRRHAQPFA
ncbi:helix-turn-helix transcriptional regulator [Flavimaricola marinus]|nr:helix-turn-helix transcriptional regulator [Flavimaricola marinus]